RLAATAAGYREAALLGRSHWAGDVLSSRQLAALPGPRAGSPTNAAACGSPALTAVTPIRRCGSDCTGAVLPRLHAEHALRRIGLSRQTRRPKQTKGRSATAADTRQLHCCGQPRPRAGWIGGDPGADARLSGAAQSVPGRGRQPTRVFEPGTGDTHAGLARQADQTAALDGR